MILGETQQYASPEEALKHYGKKGMRWGVRNEEQPSSRDNTPKTVAQRNEVAKQRIAESIVTKNATLPQMRTSGGRVEKVEKQEHQGIGGLSPTQKKALLAAGVGVVAIGGFVAYRHYTGGSIRPEDFDVSELAKRPLSKQGLGELSRTHASYKLKNPDGLMVDVSKGYADIRSIDGFPNEYVANRHGELIKTFEEMREKFPAVRNMNVEVVPMSQVPGMEGMAAMKSPAAVMAMAKGEARILYNDTMDVLEPFEEAYVREWQPGVFTKDFLGNHEMGHLLAVAHGELPPGLSLVKASEDFDFRKSVKASLRYGRAKNKYHKELFKKHGLSYGELKKLSKYAATEPAEALAELSGHYFTPEMRSKMDPGMLRKAEALFNDMGGLR